MTFLDKHESNMKARAAKITGCSEKEGQFKSRNRDDLKRSIDTSINKLDGML